MKFDELRSQPVLLLPNTEPEVVRFADKDHVWVNGRQFISLKRVGEMLKEKRMTNAEKIRSMSDEELAVEMEDIISEDCLMCPVMKTDCPVWESKDIRCKDAMLEWLKEEVSE